MIKCVDKGIWTCRTRENKPKKFFNTADEAIEFAKWVNKKFENQETKQVAYKCSHCGKYHLLTVNKKK